MMRAAAHRLAAVGRHVAPEAVEDVAGSREGCRTSAAASEGVNDATGLFAADSPAKLISTARELGATDTAIDGCLAGGREQILDQLRALIASVRAPLDLANQPSNWTRVATEAELTTVGNTPLSVSLEMITSPQQSLARRKTKIVCTLGPASWSEDAMAGLLDAGCNVGRFNFSHGSHETHQKNLDQFRAVCAAKGSNTAILVDTKGPEIRSSMLKGGQDIFLEAGEEVIIYAAGDDYTTYEGFRDRESKKTNIGCSYAALASTVSPGDRILFADGMVVLSVLEIVDDKNVRCICHNRAKLGERKNCNLPGVKVELPVLMDKDIDDLQNFACKNQVDYVAISFVQSGEDVQYVRQVLDSAGGQNIQIISKIENEAGLQNFDTILQHTDGVMVARGDLGMEIPPEKIPLAQKWMIAKCNQAGKFVVTATQLLESMISSPLPTRAEMTDVANSVFDGTDATMLSGETANGIDPSNACATMAAISATAELACDFSNVVKARRASSDELAELASAVELVGKINDSSAELAVCLCDDLDLLREIAHYKPTVPVVVGTRSERIARATSCLFGVWPCLIEDSAACTVFSVLDAAAKIGIFTDEDSTVVLLGADKTVELLQHSESMSHVK